MTRYGAMLCDPPWAFRTYSKKDVTPHRKTVDHYTTMGLPALERIPVRDWAARDCALFLWAVDSHLDQAIALGQTWGFEYKTIAFVWTKGHIGMGYWTRKQAEICLLFTRGKPKRKSCGVPQHIAAPRREHSRKPDEIYTRIEGLVNGPYLEMFARQRWLRWDQWGNEVDRFAPESISP